MRLLGTIFLCSLTLAACDCSGGSGEECTTGEVGCACASGDRCFSGLECVAGTCRTPGGGTDMGMGTDFGTGGTDAGPTDASVPADVGPNPDAFFADDPPPMECREDGTMGDPAEVPGGTPECPDDKNREGCRCENRGETAACWPGLRVNRDRGICMDGVTTCEPYDEFSGRWGPCVGAVLPVEGATLGPQACRCFSEGRWEIDNLSPCFAQYGSTGSAYHAVSTTMTGGTIACPPIGTAPPPPVPGTPWSTNRLTVDCEGRFELCYTLRAGSVETASDADCVVAEVCTTDWYAERGVAQEFPPLPAWSGTDSACATAFATTGGYGEMSVTGLSVECEEIDDMGGRYVFNRVNYCPLSCNEDPSAPECEGCMAGGSGSF